MINQSVACKVNKPKNIFESKLIEINLIFSIIIGCKTNFIVFRRSQTI